jgi:hypothetical protein
VSTTEELLKRESNGSGLENPEYGGKDPSRCTLYSQKVPLTSPTNGRYSSLSDSGQGVQFSFSGAVFRFALVLLGQRRSVVDVKALCTLH